MPSAWVRAPEKDGKIQPDAPEDRTPICTVYLYITADI